jgi:hypothetical protein
VVDFLIEQWGRWKRNPEEAKALIFRQYFHQIVVPPPGDDDWVRSHLHHVNLPNPSVETVTEWLTRARKLYDDRASIRHTKRKPRFSRWDDFARHCHWFVQVQMLGQSPSKVARLAMIDRAAIERGTLAIAKLLNLPRRRWPRGRHSQM